MKKISRREWLFIIFLIFFLLIILFFYQNLKSYITSILIENTEYSDSPNDYQQPKKISFQKEVETLFVKFDSVCPFPVEEYSSLSIDERQKFDGQITQYLSVVTEKRENCKDYLPFLQEFLRESSTQSPLLKINNNELVMSVYIELNIPLTSTSTKPIFPKVDNRFEGIITSANSGYYRLSYREVNASDLIILARDKRVSKIKIIQDYKLMPE